MGQMFVRILVDAGLEVIAIDVDPVVGDSPLSVGRLTGDITNPSAEILHALSETDCALLAVPEQVALGSIDVLVAAMPDDSLIAHTCSVQGPMAARLMEVKNPLQAVGFNPMFGPSLLPQGRPIAEIIIRDGPLVEHLSGILKLTSADLVVVTAENHDRICSITQAAAHAAIISFGLAIMKSGVSHEELVRLAPPPCVTLLALLARVASGSPEVYWDVQFANPQAAESRTNLIQSAGLLDQMIEDGDIAAFEIAISEIASYFDSSLSGFADIAQDLLARLPSNQI